MISWISTKIDWICTPSRVCNVKENGNSIIQQQQQPSRIPPSRVGYMELDTSH